MSGALGAGSVVGALFLSSRKGHRALSRWIIIGCALFGLSLIGFGLSSSFPLSILMLAIEGFSSMMVMAGSITVIQTIVDEDKRGRVMSLVVMAFMGFSPFGCVVAGALANVIGVGTTVVATGVLTLVLALVFCPRILGIHRRVTPVQVGEVIKEADSEIAVVNS